MSYTVSIEGQKIPLPDEIGASDEKVRQALAPYFPDAANALITRTEKDGETTINVVKKAGTKGSVRGKTWVRNFVYNGFFGELKDGYAGYTAQFKEWTNDPGVGWFQCSDGETRLVPTFALDPMPDNLPNQSMENKILFGVPCES